MDFVSPIILYMALFLFILVYKYGRRWWYPLCGVSQRDVHRVLVQQSDCPSTTGASLQAFPCGERTLGRMMSI